MWKIDECQKILVEMDGKWLNFLLFSCVFFKFLFSIKRPVRTKKTAHAIHLWEKKAHRLKRPRDEVPKAHRQLFVDTLDLPTSWRFSRWWFDELVTFLLRPRSLEPLGHEVPYVGWLSSSGSKGHFEEGGSDIAFMDGIIPIDTYQFVWNSIYFLYSWSIHMLYTIYLHNYIIVQYTFVSETCVHRGLSYQMTAKTTVVGRKHCCIGFACPQALKSAFSWLYPDGVSKPFHFFVKTWEMLEFGIAHYMILLYSGFNHHL